VVNLEKLIENRFLATKKMNEDLELRRRLPNECWSRVISFLPRISRQSLAFLYGFREIVDGELRDFLMLHDFNDFFPLPDTSQMEERRLYQALKNGNLRWSKVAAKNIQPRLRHGTINFNDQLVIFGGASGNLQNSGTYNDVWRFDFIKNFHRMSTSNEIPSPRANFGFVRAGDKILTAGGRTLNYDPFLSHQNQFEVHLLNPKLGSWQKVVTSGTEPQHSNGVRCVMLTPTELIVISGFVPQPYNWVQEGPNGNFENHRTNMQIFILKFNDIKLERGTWYRLADCSSNRRGTPMPRADFHLVKTGSDSALMIGGLASNQVLQDAWVMKITRQPSYSLRWIQVTVENPLIPSLPLHIFPSCLVGGDLLVFTGVRTFMKKPGIEKPKEEPKKLPPEPPATPSTSSSSQMERRTPPIFINLERPLNTIGVMAAFSVSPQPVMPPLKVLKIQTPEPSPEPPRQKLQDYPMRVFCLDLSTIINATDEVFRSNPTLHWLTMKNGGLFTNAPELRAHGTFTQIDKSLCLIGGVRRNQVEDDILFTQATNDVYILDYVHDDT
jgi:Galactose oxidase, central domain